MHFVSSNVHIRPSNTKHTQFNSGNDKENPRIVITLNESHLSKWSNPTTKIRKKVKVINKFESTDSQHRKACIDEMPIRLWITPENTLYELLSANKSLDGWFTLDIIKSWGSFYDVVEWTLNERIDAPNEIIQSSFHVVESREVKLQRIAENGFQRIFSAHPGFLSKVEQWYAAGQENESSSCSLVTVGDVVYPLSSRHLTMIRRLRRAQKTDAQLEQLQGEIQPTMVTMKVLEYLAKWHHAPLLAGLIPLKFTDPTRDIIAEDRPFTNRIKLFRVGKVQTFFGHIGTHFEHALEQNDIVTKLLCEPYALCLQLHVPFKQVDELVQFEGLYTKAQLTDPEGPLLTQRIASRLVQQLRKHPLGWTSFDSFRVGNRQLHHEMLEDLGIEDNLWMEQIRRIASMEEEDDHFFVSKLEFFDERQVALVSDVSKEETIVRVLSQLETSKEKYQVDETLLAKHIHNNFTMQGRQLDEDQEAALYLLLENQVAVLCGPGGSGKTTIIKTVLDYLMDERKAEIKLNGGHDLIIEAVAPTGKAAVNLSKSINMPCSTCHKAVFGQNSKNRIDDTEEDVEYVEKVAGAQVKAKQHQVDVLVIDEISMLDILVAGHLLAMVEKTASNAGSKYKQRYFLLGDVNQLPPVGPGQLALDLERYKEKLRIPTARLTKIHRYGEEMTRFNEIILRQVKEPGCEQMDLSPYKVASTAEQDNIIQVYEMPDYAGNRTVWIEKALDLYCRTRERMHSGSVVDGKNKSLFMCTYTNEFCNLMNPLIQDAVNPIVHDYTKQQYEQLAKSNAFLAQFRAGDKVYHTMNWYGPNLPELMNGLSGVVSGLDFEEQTLTVLYDGKLVEYTKEMMEEHPHCITLAYCGTVHKAQGDGYHEVIYVGNQNFGNARVAYTASTRSIERLMILTNQKIWDAQLANPYEDRHSKMAWSLQL